MALIVTLFRASTARRILKWATTFNTGPIAQPYKTQICTMAWLGRHRHWVCCPFSKIHHGV